MRHYLIEVTEQTAADPATVYALLRDGSTWPAWTPLESFELEREGHGEREGVGAIRIFRSGRITGWDEVTGFDTDRSFSYAHLRGLPVKDYRGQVNLEPTTDGTSIRWRVTFGAKVPGTGPLLQLRLRRFLGQTVRGLAAHAAGR